MTINGERIKCLRYDAVLKAEYDKFLAQPPDKKKEKKKKEKLENKEEEEENQEEDQPQESTL